MNAPTPERECNKLIYDQLLPFISVLSGVAANYSKHSINVVSNQTRNDRLSLELHYGHHFSNTPNTVDKTRCLLWGNQENLEKIPFLFPNWRKNFQFIEPLVHSYMKILEDDKWIHHEHLLDSIKMIEEYAIRKSMISCNKEKPDIERRLFSVMSYIQQNGLSYFQGADVDEIADQIKVFRNKGSHARNKQALTYSTQEIYGVLVLIMRSLLLIEMGFPNIDVAYSNWIDINQQLPKT